MAKDKLILKRDAKSGTVYLRQGYIAAFFLPVPIDAIVAPIGAAFEYCLSMMSPGALKWQSIGAGSQEWRPLAKDFAAKCRAQLDPKAARKRDLTAFELTGCEQGGDAPIWGISVLGNPVDKDLPQEDCLFQIHLPWDAFEGEALEANVGHAVELAKLLPYVSGYLSPVLAWAPLEKDRGLREARAFAMRYPGFDVEDNAIGRSYLDEQVRGARWISFLGKEVVSRLGGETALKRALPAPFDIRKVGKGLMVRAGVAPQIGANGKKDTVPLLCRLARTLEPVTAFEEVALLRTEFADLDVDVLKRWERRFLD
jgi:TseV toxin immunity protein TsiV